MNKIPSSVLAACLILALAPILAADTPAIPATLAKQPLNAYDVAVYQRDAAMKALQDAQVQLALANQEVSSLNERIAALQKELDALKNPPTPTPKK